MPKHSICAEVGVQNGENAVRILERACPRQLHLIDTWGGQSGGHERVKEMIVGQPATLHKGRSVVVGNRFSDNFFDWVYVDANHEYEFVSEDLRLYYRKIKHGGILSGHDYSRLGSKNNFVGVKKAVHEMINEGLCKLICFTNEPQQRSFAMKVIKPSA